MSFTIRKNLMEWQSYTILIVDDAKFMRSILKEIIQSMAGVTEFFEAADGFEAVKQYQSMRPDLVIMDINMPRVDGIQALKAIMKINSRAKVVMLTAVDQKSIVQEAMRLGARDYIVKPIDRVNISFALQRVLKQS